MTQTGCSVLCLLYSLLDPGRVVFSVSSVLYLIFGWSDSFLCLSAFYHYDKIPEIINIKRGRIYIVYWVWSFQCVITWPHCLLGLCKAQMYFCLITRKAKTDNNWLGLNITFRAHLPRPLKDFTTCYCTMGWVLDFHSWSFLYIYFFLIFNFWLFFFF
jgi:hypothetical protein